MNKPTTMKLSSFIFLVIVMAIVFPCVSMIRVNNDKLAARIKLNQCYAAALADHDAQLEMLTYQVDNNYLNWYDAVSSKEYIDFLENKANTICDGTP